jgi:hypothetical protein
VQQTTLPRPSAPQAPVIFDPRALPRTAQDVRAARIMLDDLKEQLQDAASRRRTVSDQLRGADPAARAGLESRMGELDTRILQIEKAITVTSAELRGAPAGALIEAGSGFGSQVSIARIASDVVPIVAILSVFVLGPMSIALSRLIWRRASAPPKQPAVDHATQQRLDQLQQAVDTIAIEVERISEGQRFVTKLLSDPRPALPPGGAEQGRTSRKAAPPGDGG